MNTKKLALSVFAILTILLNGCKKTDNQDVTSDNEKTYIVISDIHLGDNRSINEGYAQNLQMRDTLCAFLDYLNENNDWDELVVNGDLVDEWVTMPSYNTFSGSEGESISEMEFFQNVVTANQQVFDKLRQLKNAGHKIVYIPGNHDMQVTAQDFETVLPGLFDQARTDGVDGMGEYQPDNEIFIEHGHRYDIFNAPYIGKVGVDDIPEGSILPPGFFVSKLACGYRMTNEKRQEIQQLLLDSRNIDYDIFWNGIGLIIGKDDVVTNTDGMTLTYSFDDYAGSDSKLFYGIDNYYEENDGWNARCNRNQARFVPTLQEALAFTFLYNIFDKMGLKWLKATDAEPHILIWSHSHSPKLIAEQTTRGKVIYVNTGCWIDANNTNGTENTGTFCKVVKSTSGYNVSLRRFSIDADGNNRIDVIGEESF